MLLNVFHLDFNSNIVRLKDGNFWGLRAVESIFQF